MICEKCNEEMVKGTTVNNGKQRIYICKCGNSEIVDI